MSIFRRGVPILDSFREGKLWRRDHHHFGDSNVGSILLSRGFDDTTCPANRLLKMGIPVSRPNGPRL